MDTVLRSRSTSVTIGAEQPFCVIGERINPTGRKACAEELRGGDLSTVTVDALAQVKAAQANVAVAQAQVATAQADLHTADIQLGYTHVVAPVDGRITKRAVDVGNVISVGEPLLAIVSDNLWVTANYKETQLKKMRANQVVAIRIDAVPDVTFEGHVQSFQRAAGSFFSALPAENATGNYVKVTQRVPVKIVFDHPEDLQKYNVGPGLSVKPSVAVD